MAVSSRNRNRRMSVWVRCILWAIPVIFLLLIAGFFAAKSMIDAYLRSDAFREMIAHKAGDTLHAKAEIEPLSFSSNSIFSNNFSAQGGPDAAFSELGIEQIRTEISLRRFFEKVWQVEQFDVQRVHVNLEGPRINLPREPAANPLASSKPTDNSTGWLPNRVEIGHATVHDTQFEWKGGDLRGTAFELEPHEGSWQIAGQGGRITYGKLPPLDVDNLHLRYRAPSLFVSNADLRETSGGALQASGEIDFSRQLDLNLKLANINITPFLSDDWRLRAKGNLSGTVDVHCALPAHGSPQISGSLQIAQGELTALPVLDQIATFTRTVQFRRINLSNVSGDFKQEGDRLAVTNFVAESNGLIRTEGAFTIQNGMIDGTFQVGVTQSSLQWLPGSQGKVFTEARGGYIWTSMRLTGPVNKPNEDLTPRLIAAAEGAIIEGVQNAAGEAVKGVQNAAEAAKGAGDAVKTGKDAVKSALELLLPTTK